MKKIFILSAGFLGVFGLAAYLSLHQPESPSRILAPISTENTYETNATRSTVTITNLDQTSGGSGAILAHNHVVSTILTNAHVCGVVANGGYVITDKGTKHVVVRYLKSKTHDLCLIYVAEDLKHSVPVASVPPKKFQPAKIIGHPSLFPTVITTGHFSDKSVIQVTTGMRACTQEDLEDPMVALFCMFFGGLPTVTNYESILVSATIMPGSSGSSIYNESGEVSAVAFAGQGSLGYAFAVPLEYLQIFLLDAQKAEAKDYETPDMNLHLGSPKKHSKLKFDEAKVKEFCDKSKDVSPKLAKICAIVTRIPTRF